MEKINPKTRSRENKIAALKQILNDALDMLLLDKKARDSCDGRKFEAAALEIREIKESIFQRQDLRKSLDRDPKNIPKQVYLSQPSTPGHRKTRKESKK